MKAIDLSQTLENGMAVYPGAPEPHFEQIGSVKNGDIYQLIKFTMTTHTGTHMDCNTHVTANGYYTDAQDIGFFIGKGLVIDCRKYGKNAEMGMEIFDKVNLDGVNFVFLYCDWAKLWGSKEFWSDYPFISRDVAQFLAKHPTVRALGVEYASIDPADQAGLDLHKIFLAEEKSVIENLTNLDKLLNKSFTYVGFPLKFKGGEGSPIRAVALVDE
ncbi:MAG: cyclase family protein [Deltaproteobacteria bacterium]|jgi:kynurenine formamidase|nr:cyclase family protein [Deltaproteobacteria bacterium]